MILQQFDTASQCNIGQAYISACHSGSGYDMNKGRCEIYLQSSYIIYQNECRAVKNVQRSLRQYDRKDRYSSRRESYLF